jgi:hypothetical protein
MGSRKIDAHPGPPIAHYYILVAHSIGQVGFLSETSSKSSYQSSLVWVHAVRHQGRRK